MIARIHGLTSRPCAHLTIAFIGTQFPSSPAARNSCQSIETCAASRWWISVQGMGSTPPCCASASLWTTSTRSITRRVPRRCGPACLSRIGNRRFFASRLRGNGSIGPVIAIDKAECAIRYAESVGLVDYGASEDLEDEEPSTELRRRLLGASLVTVTGGMGYIGPRTMENILANVGPSILPWIIAFPLVGTPLEPFYRVFSDFGLRVEVWNNETFPQRLVANGEDHFHSVSGVCNHAPSPSMSHVYLQTRLLCARPADEADVLPLSDVM